MRLPRTLCLTSLVLIAQAVILLEHGHMQTHKFTDATDHPTHVMATTGVGDDIKA